MAKKINTVTITINLGDPVTAYQQAVEAQRQLADLKVGILRDADKAGFNPYSFGKATGTWHNVIRTAMQAAGIIPEGVSRAEYSAKVAPAKTPARSKPKAASKPAPKREVTPRQKAKTAKKAPAATAVAARRNTRKVVVPIKAAKRSAAKKGR